MSGLYSSCGEADGNQTERNAAAFRLYYNHNIYRGFPERKSKSVEINQVGIELIGGSSWRSDLEVVELAARSLDKISGGKYRLELCHIGYFKAIMGSLDTDEETKEEIRLLIEQKNYASLTDILGKAQENKVYQYPSESFRGFLEEKRSLKKLMNCLMKTAQKKVWIT